LYLQDGPLQPSAITMVAEGGPGDAGREQSAPIHEAAARGNEEAVAALLAAAGGGAATTALCEQRDGDGCNALWLAAHNGHTRVRDGVHSLFLRGCA
jgi:hypothetical protein